MTVGGCLCSQLFEMFSNCFFFQICESSGIQMACPLDLWLFGVGQHKTTSSLCLPQSETEISIWSCAGLPVCRREKLNGSVKDIQCTLFYSSFFCQRDNVHQFHEPSLDASGSKKYGLTCKGYFIKRNTCYIHLLVEIYCELYYINNSSFLLEL